MSLRLTSLLLFSVILSPVALAAADSRETEVRKALQSYADCWNSRNSGDCMDKLLSSDFTQVSRTGRPGDRNSVKQSLKDDAVIPTPMAVAPDTRVKFYGDAALVTYSSMLPWGNRDTPAEQRIPVKHFISQLWVKNPTGWQVVHAHISYPPIPPKKAQ